MELVLEGNGLLERKRQFREAGRIQRTGIDSAVASDPPSELQPGDREGRSLTKLLDLGPREFEQELQGIGLHGGSRQYAGPGDAQLLAGPTDPLLGHAQQLTLRDYVIVVGLRGQCGLVTGLEFARGRPVHRGSGCRQVIELRPTPEQIVRRRERIRRQPVGHVVRADVELLGRKLRVRPRKVDRRQDERRPRSTPDPRRVTDLPERLDIVRVDIRSSFQGLGQRHDRNRVRLLNGLDVCCPESSTSLDGYEQGPYHGPSTRAGVKAFRLRVR